MGEISCSVSADSEVPGIWTLMRILANRKKKLSDQFPKGERETGTKRRREEKEEEGERGKRREEKGRRKEQRM